MKQRAFEQKYAQDWQAFEALLDVLDPSVAPGREKNRTARRKNHRLSKSQVAGFPEAYRRLCHYLALARERQYSSRLTDHLNSLVLRGHQQLYKRKSDLRSTIIGFVVAGFPRAVRAQWKFCAVSAAVFVLPGLILMGLTLMFPELVFSVFDPKQLNEFESMYDPAARHIGRVRDADTDFAMFGYYIRNNIGIGFQIFAGGLLFGIGSLFFLLYNGIVFGALSAHIVNVNFQETFFSFVIGHGSFELTAIVLSGGAGLQLGYALIAPGRFTRRESLRRAAGSAIQIVYGVLLMLLIAAFIEAFWSSSTLVPTVLKYWVGGGLWVLVLGYFVGMGRGRKHDAV